MYDYEHLGEPCALGNIFEIYQSVKEDSLTECPQCKTPVRKRISRTGLSIPKSNAELRDLGFTKLVKRDDGVYENVTRRGSESRYMERGKSETMPDFSKIISD
jgi:predicted nucleic acid-binding Zn ribbon protein